MFVYTYFMPLTATVFDRYNRSLFFCYGQMREKINKFYQHDLLLSFAGMNANNDNVEERGGGGKSAQKTVKANIHMQNTFLSDTISACTTI